VKLVVAVHYKFILGVKGYSVWLRVSVYGMLGDKEVCMTAIKQEGFESFAEFYPYYLQEHSHAVCRRLHFVGTSCVLLLLGYVFASQNFVWLWAFPVIGYGFAWVGHFFFEKNRPATFKHPFYSLAGDFVMYKDMIIGRVSW